MHHVRLVAKLFKVADKCLSGFVIFQVNHLVIAVSSPHGKSGNAVFLAGDTGYQVEVATLKAGIYMLRTHDVGATHIVTE